ncbi:hypothetical protein WR25_23337 [Diploscapter pachys]|uniref:Uncharacterized protein n=1 Tax=Diploscapter pachys TaxID=2018661 RepID=A0A2A2KJJ5_9BILA|nr:hypothetical protein WR25_23337 [Diploscapter pachys]
MLRLVILILAVFLVVNAEIRARRQTYTYPEALRAYAHPHRGTQIQQGFLSRYAPQDWPSWYVRNMMKWDNNFITSPYDKTDYNYPGWKREFISRSRFLGPNSN